MKTVNVLKTSSILLVASLLVYGCGAPNDPPKPDDGADTGSEIDAGSSTDGGDGGDAGVEEDGGDDDNDMDVCMPETECAQDACGMIDDGCGGTLDCGVCECVDGQPSQATCGVCGLGELACEAAVTGAGTCSAPFFGGVEAQAACDTLVYVDAGAAEATQDGSKENPYVSLSAALKLTQAPAVVLMAQGNYVESDKWDGIRSGIHVVGGFDASTWAWSDTNTTTLVSGVDSADGMVALYARNISEPTVLAHITINTPVAAPGINTFGILVRDSPALVLSNVNVLLPALQDGEAGLDGLDGADGEDGGNAAVAYRTRSTSGDTRTNPAGVGAINVSCVGSNGGDGGRGSYSDLTQSGIVSADAAQGLDSVGGASRGPAGSQVSPTGGDGGTRPASLGGMDGAPGRASGAVLDGVWKLTSGDGEDGTAGGDGIGGGGGGGSWWPSADPGEQRYGFTPGASGGGGGAGGCGGAAGLGGMAGGSSIALLVLNSTGLTVVNSSFVAGRAGDGGKGGTGGLGGVGGLGGDPTRSLRAHDDPPPGQAPLENHPSIAGSGGEGANGGSGGAGGSGAGGSSYGAWCEGSSITLEGSVEFVAGAPGQGGAGIIRGEDGQSALEQGCGS